MKEYTSNNPVFSSSIQLVETSDPAHADNINASPKQLLQNDLTLKDSIEQLSQNIELKQIYGDSIIIENSIAGNILLTDWVKNLFDSTAESKTVNGITFTVNEDGSVIANGTASGNTGIDFSPITLNKGTYTLSGSVDADIIFKLANSVTNIEADSSNHTFTIDKTTIFNIVQIIIINGKSVSNEYLYPMLEEGEVVHPYVPNKGYDIVSSDSLEEGQVTTVHVTNNLESPVYGLKSYEGTTYITAPSDVTVVYAENEIGCNILNGLQRGQVTSVNGQKGDVNITIPPFNVTVPLKKYNSPSEEIIINNSKNNRVRFDYPHIYGNYSFVHIGIDFNNYSYSIIANVDVLNSGSDCRYELNTTGSDYDKLTVLVGGCISTGSINQTRLEVEPIGKDGESVYVTNITLIKG